MLNLKSGIDISVLRTLAKDADVLVYNIRPQAMRKLSLDYDTLAIENPRLVYCGLYGFSESGPYAGKPAFDDIIQAMSGLADLQGRTHAASPSYVPSIIADKIVGLAGVNAILAALYERSCSGLGQTVEVPMFETMVGFNLLEHMGGATFGEESMGYARALSPFRKPYRTKDGYIGLLPYTSEQWQRFFQIAGCPQVMQDPRFGEPNERAKHIAQLYELLESLTPQRTTEEWLTVLDQADIPASRVNRLEDLRHDPHLSSIAFFRQEPHPTEGNITFTDVSTHFSRTPANIRSLAPSLGEHSKTIKTLLGLSGEG